MLTNIHISPTNIPSTGVEDEKKGVEQPNIISANTYAAKFSLTTWYQGLPLLERLANLGNLGSADDLPEAYLKKAKAKLARWKEQTPFNKDIADVDFFAQRLASENLTQDQLLYLLAEPSELLAARTEQSPGWLVSLKQAFADYGNAENIGLRADETKSFGQLLTALNPVIEQGFARLRAGITELANRYDQEQEQDRRAKLPFEPSSVLDLLSVNLPGCLLPKISRVMVLELNVTRVQGRLHGATPKERFANFVSQIISQPANVLAILEEYPVLAQQIVSTVDTWVNVTLEFLQRLCADWETVRKVFSPQEEPGLLVEVDAGAGDSHRGGRSVYRLMFQSGFQLMYKPKSLGVDQHFQELLAWLNDRGHARETHLDFRLLKLLNRESYGWVEFIKPFECETPEEVARFYVRQGGYLALLYALEATDFHAENLIAAGEHPILIDLEALFHPRLDKLADQKKTAADLATDNIGFSVLRVGLLPQRLWFNEEAQSLDISGLGGKGGQLTPQPVPVWQGIGPDELKLARQRMPLSGSNNRPSLRGVGDDIDVLDYTQQITQGFKKVYELLIAHKEELVTGPLQAFADDEIRIILRPTRTYAHLLEESFHPDLLRDALERERFLDYLWLNVEGQPSLKHFILAEKTDLLAGDIPMFTTQPGSKDVLDSRGGITTDFLAETSLQAVSRHIQGLNSADLTRQLWFVEASLATLAFNLNHSTRRRIQYEPTHNEATPEQLIEVAYSIGQRLAELALVGKEDITWVGLTAVNETDCALIPAGMDLYSGLPGIALFLAYLGEITQDSSMTRLAKLAVATIDNQLQSYQEHGRPSLGAFDGLAGIVYLYTQLGVLWREDGFFEKAQALVEPIGTLIAKDEALDIISGVAGCILSLLSLYKVAPHNRTLEVAIQCGEHLLNKSAPLGEQRGVAWKTKMSNKVPLTGFSHGNAGIGYSLLELAAQTGIAKFKRLALEAFAYEQSVFSAEHGNWPDYRELNDLLVSSEHSATDTDTTSAKHQHDNVKEYVTTTQQPVICATLWCHGAPGIGLGRLAGLQHLTETEAAPIRREIADAINTTLNTGFGRNHSLCHGDLGNLELLMLAASHWESDTSPKSEDLRKIVANQAAMILESVAKTGWIAGIPLGVETVGLMIGLAGMGYQLLRLAKPEEIPSVLLLASPPQLLSQEPSN